MSEKVLVEISARHVHVTQETLEVLFGKGHQLTKKKDLSQPGQYACEEKVVVKGERGELKCSILGPCRSANQVELSLTDARTAGLKALVRESGDIKGTCGCTLVGPCGEVTISEGVIAAKRHVHLTEADAQKFGVKNGDVVSLKLDTADRALTFSDVVIRVSDKFAAAAHVDTDEANAACIPGTCMAEIIK